MLNNMCEHGKSLWEVKDIPYGKVPKAELVAKGKTLKSRKIG